MVVGGCRCIGVLEWSGRTGLVDGGGGCRCAEAP